MGWRFLEQKCANRGVVDTKNAKQIYKTCVSLDTATPPPYRFRHVFNPCDGKCPPKRFYKVPIHAFTAASWLHVICLATHLKTIPSLNTNFSKSKQRTVNNTKKKKSKMDNDKGLNQPMIMRGAQRNFPTIRNPRHAIHLVFCIRSQSVKCGAVPIPDRLVRRRTIVHKTGVRLSTSLAKFPRRAERVLACLTAFVVRLRHYANRTFGGHHL